MKELVIQIGPFQGMYSSPNRAMVIPQSAIFLDQTLRSDPTANLQKMVLSNANTPLMTLQDVTIVPGTPLSLISVAMGDSYLDLTVAAAVSANEVQSLLFLLAGTPTVLEDILTLYPGSSIITAPV